MKQTVLNRCVFLDRDGTLVEERDYLRSPSELSLIVGVAGGLRQLSRLGLKLVVVTNQSAVGRGMITLRGLETIHDRMRQMLAAEGVLLDGIYFCPHSPVEGCNCRKPLPGLVETAVRELCVDPTASFLIGDKQTDLELGHRVGATTLLVRTGYGPDLVSRVGNSADYVVRDLAEAAIVIEGLLDGEEGDGLENEREPVGRA